MRRSFVTGELDPFDGALVSQALRIERRHW
jgi:hypothetical protein